MFRARIVRFYALALVGVMFAWGSRSSPARLARSDLQTVPDRRPAVG
jgi:hypothetical protein